MILSGRKHPERVDRGLSGVIKRGLIIKDGLKLPASDSRVGRRGWQKVRVAGCRRYHTLEITTRLLLEL